MPNNINNSDSTRQVNRYIKEYSQHLWDSELTGDPEYVIVRHNNKNKSVRSRSKDSTRYYPYPSFEGGAPTIGPGFKLNDTSSFTKKVKTKGFATRDQPQRFRSDPFRFAWYPKVAYPTPQCRPVFPL